MPPIREDAKISTESDISEATARRRSNRLADGIMQDPQEQLAPSTLNYIYSKSALARFLVF
jgi:hypothetical protein